MTKLGRLAACLMLAAVVCSAQDVFGFIHGTGQESRQSDEDSCSQDC